MNSQLPSDALFSRLRSGHSVSRTELMALVECAQAAREYRQAMKKQGIDLRFGPLNHDLDTAIATLEKFV